MTAPVTNPAPFIKQQYFTTNGLPLASGQIWTYQAGTSTPQPTYTDSTGLSLNTNPVILDSTGKANIWLDITKFYKFVVMDLNSVVQYTEDNIPGTPPSLLPVPIPIVDGGTGGTSAAQAISNLGAAKAGTLILSGITGAAENGANASITSLSGLTTPLSVTQGGTGAGTIPINNVILGNGTSPIQYVAPGTSGNLLTSDGSTWQSTPIVIPAIYGVGINQAWQNVLVSRATATPYQNTSGSPIMVSITRTVEPSAITTGVEIVASPDGVTYVTIGAQYSNIGGMDVNMSVVIPNNWYYKETGSGEPISYWAELR